MEIRQARKSSVSIMPVFFCGDSGTKTQGGSERREEKGPAQEDRADSQGEDRVMVWVPGRGKEQRVNRCKYVSRETSTGRRRTKMQKSVHRMESDEARGTWAPRMFPRETPRAEVGGQSK